MLGGRFRYRLRFQVNPQGRKGRIGIIGLNPSFATKSFSDQTVDFFGAAIAYRLGYEELEILNIFPTRSSRPKAWVAGSGGLLVNDKCIAEAVGELDLLVVAWGSLPRAFTGGAREAFRGRVDSIRSLLRERAEHLIEMDMVRAVGVNADGNPRHLSMANVLPGEIDDLDVYPL
ncbi:DUF1643 domain-containing protein [Myxococcus qinghaiensis]|uniref:DUF1643 domain-containing protein n=1 Tax=Myxococcus qinghaiensis TaxID=2906758 RepID=UPI0038991B26